MNEQRVNEREGGHNCKQLGCAFNDLGICSLSFESDEEGAWENFGPGKCKKEVIPRVTPQEVDND